MDGGIPPLRSSARGANPVAKKVKVDVGTPRAHGRADNEITFLVEKYLERHPSCFDEDGAIDIEAILTWAFESGIYRPPPPDPRQQLRRRIRRHLGQRYKTDPQGREVRALIAVPRQSITPNGVKRSFGYYPLFETHADVIQSGLSLRSTWAFKRVEQIHTDRESYNDNNIFGETIPQMSFDFDKRLKESQMPTTYPDAPPDDQDEDDEDESLD
jgi:hypothetical protein